VHRQSLFSLLVRFKHIHTYCANIRSGGISMFGDRLKILRTEKGLIQKELAELLKVSPSTVGMYERNQRDPDTETIRFLADYFDVSADFLLCRTNHRKYDTMIAEEATAYLDGLDDDEIMVVRNMIEMLKKNKKYDK